MVCYLLGKIGGNSYCCSRDMSLVCEVFKQDHIIKGSGEHNNKSLLRQITKLPICWP